MLHTSHLSDTQFANIFSQSVSYLFICLTVPFQEKFLILKKSNLPIFSLVGHAFGIASKKLQLAQGYESFLLIIPRILIILGFTFRSLTHFE